MSISYSLTLSIALSLVAAFGPSAEADELDALKDQTIRAVIGSSPGGTTDTVARLFLTHVRNVLPETTIRIQNIEGGGGAKAIKEIQEARGSTITMGILNYGAIYRQLVSPEVSPYDLTRLQWIGSIARVQRLLTMREGLGGTSFDTLLKLDRQPIAGSEDAFDPSAIETLLLNAMTGLRTKLVTGMSNDQRDALLLSGDVDVDLSNPFGIGDEMIPILKFTKDGFPASFDEIPSIGDVLRPGVPDDLPFLMETLDRSGRMVAAAPETDANLVEALRHAFDRVVADPGFVGAMEDLKIAVSRTSGPELASRLDRILGPSSSDFRATVQSYLDCGKRISESGAATSCE
jgi:tripartite-type tricarboxylate transporter receptor subunit TctC